MKHVALFIVAFTLNGCDRVDPRTAILERIGDINDFSQPRPLVSLELFFDGNDDYGSIGYNFYPDQPSPSEFYAFFKSIRDRDNVSDVLIEVKDLEVPEEWPSTDTVWIITTASPDDLNSWLGKRFRADELLMGFPNEDVEKYDVPEGYTALGVWYD